MVGALVSGQDEVMPIVAETDVFPKATVYITKEPAENVYIDTSKAELVSKMEDSDAWEPDVAVDGEGTAHVVWRDRIKATGYKNSILYRSMTLDGKWNDTEIVSEKESNSREPTIAVTEDGIVHVAWHESSAKYGVKNQIHYRIKDKDDWDDVEIISHPTESNSWEPDIAVDETGIAHLVWRDKIKATSYKNSVLYRSRTVDGIWNDTKNVSEKDSSSREPVVAALEKGIAHVVWHEASAKYGVKNQIQYRKIEDGDSGGLEIVSHPLKSDSWEPDIAVDCNGNVHVSWRDRTIISNNRNAIFYRNRTSNNTWSDWEIVSEKGSYCREPGISAGQNGEIHHLWHDDMAKYGDKNQIFYLDNKSGFRILTQPEDSNSWDPHIASNNNGVVYAVWKDRIKESKYDNTIYLKRIDSVDQKIARK